MSDEPIQILLATYNGERFLREQLDSLLAQTWRPLRILARDDGSADRTPAILAEYARDHPDMLTVEPAATPTGSARGNFLELLKRSTAPYVAFADQDDVWHPEKLARCMQAARGLEQRHAPGTPLLIFSDLSVVDGELHTLAASFWENDGIDPAIADRLPRLLLQNVVTGCTMLINRPLADLARAMPAEAFMHDWWLALLACCLGESAAVREPLVLYRQHGGNAVGAVAARPGDGSSRWRFHRDRLRQFDLSLRQAEALLRTQGERLTQAQRATLEALLRCSSGTSAAGRVATALRYRLYPTTWRRTANFLWLLWDLKAARRQFGQGSMG